MMLFNIPLFMVVAFLMLTLGVALYFKKNGTSFREYAVGDKQFSTGNLTATVLATAFGGKAVMYTVEEVHNYGIYSILFGLLVSSVPYWIISRLALRMAPFMYDLSMSETIGRVYGRFPRVITTLSHLVSAIAIIAIQINVMSLAISMCIDSANLKIISILSILSLIFYSTIGGVHIVTVTDVMQLGTFLIIFPVLAWWILLPTGKIAPEAISFALMQEKFRFSSVFPPDVSPVAIVAFWLSTMVCTINPPIIQRIYMSADHLQASRVFLSVSIAGLYIKFFILLLGLCTFVAEPELPSTEVWTYIINSVPPFFQGLVTISLLAVTMSTADSYLNSCGVMFSHEVVDSMVHIKAISYNHQLRLAKLAVLFVGILAAMLSAHCNDTIELIKIFCDCFVPIVTAPFILAVLGFRSTSRTALIGMATGLLTILAWNKWIEPTTNINGAVFCMVANCLAMVAVHYLGPKPKEQTRDNQILPNKLIPINSIKSYT